MKAAGFRLNLKVLCAASSMIHNGAYFTEESSFQLRAVSIVPCEQSTRLALIS